MKKYLVFILPVFILLTATGAAQAGTYTVKQDGTGNFTTIQACANVAKAGDTCLVHPGTYQERVSTKFGGTDESHRITFKAQGTATMQGFNIGHSYVTVDGFDITGYRSQIYIGPGGNYCQILNNTIRDGETDNVHGINFASPDGLAANNCVIRGNHLTNLNYTFLCTRGGWHLIENNIFENQNGWDFLYVFGHDQTFRRNIFRLGIPKPDNGNHGDFVQTFADNGGESYNMLFEENWIQDLDSQMAQLASGGPKGSFTTFHDYVFRKNIFVNISGNLNVGLPGVQFVNNTFYHTAYNLSGISFGGSLLGGNPSRALLKNNAFVEGGSPPDPWGYEGYYNNSGGLLAKSDLKFLPDSNTITNVFNNLVSNDYINPGGHPLTKAKSLTNISQFELDPTYDEYKTDVYNTLIKVVQFDQSIRSTFAADYNFVSGGQSEGFPAKGYFGDVDYNGIKDSELHGINGGDPQFQDISTPLGPDGIPFTLDDGLKPLPGSPLCSNGENGSDIGAYSCDPTKVFATDSTVLYGDLSGDGSVTAYDAALALQNDPRATLDKADVNGDAAVDALDAALIAQKAVGLI